MPIKTANGGNKYSYRNLKGQTLAAVDTDRRARGCKDPNSPSKRYYGLTAATIEVAPDQVTTISQMALSQHMTVTVKFFSGAVNYRAITEICVPSEKTKLTTKAKAEWDRFEKEVVKHELKHFDDTKGVAEDIASELHKMTATEKGKTLEEAGLKAKNALIAACKKKFAPAEIEKRINKVMKKRDSVDGHGSGSGARLKTSVV